MLPVELAMEFCGTRLTIILQEAFTTYDSYNEYDITLPELRPHLPGDNYLKTFGCQYRIPFGYFFLTLRVLTIMIPSDGKMCGLIWNFCV